MHVMDRQAVQEAPAVRDGPEAHDGSTATKALPPKQAVSDTPTDRTERRRRTPERQPRSYPGDHR